MAEIEVKVIGPLVLFSRVNQFEAEGSIAIGLNELNGQRGCIINTSPFGATAVQSIMDLLESRPNAIPLPSFIEDLIKVVSDFAKETEAVLERAVVNKLENRIYWAILRFDLNGGKIEIETSPTVAIAMALKSKCGIFANEELMSNGDFVDVAKIGTQGQGITSSIQPSPSDERLQKWLETVDPDKIPKE